MKYTIQLHKKIEVALDFFILLPNSRKRNLERLRSLTIEEKVRRYNFLTYNCLFLVILWPAYISYMMTGLMYRTVKVPSDNVSMLVVEQKFFNVEFIENFFFLCVFINIIWVLVSYIHLLSLKLFYPLDYRKFLKKIKRGYET